MTIKKVWIREDIFDWDGYRSSWTPNHKRILERPYEIWKHSAGLFKNKGDSDFHRADGISNLKRSINHRLQSIENIYRFRTLQFSNKPKGSLELLEVFDLARPYIVKQLFELRNNIEHRDMQPPSKERCHELLDIVWYFLKSTDYLVQTVNSEGEFTLLSQNGIETNYRFTFNLNYDDIDNSTIAGWFPDEYIRYNETDGFISIDLEEISGKEKWLGLESDYNKNKFDSDKWIKGYMKFEDDSIVKPIKTMLSLS
ncbi:hypothetical protein AB9M62_23245 [Bacillales bacterium AN1005]